MNWGWIAVIAALLSVCLFLGRLLMDHRQQSELTGGQGSGIPISTQPQVRSDADTVGDLYLSDEEKRQYIFAHPELYPKELRDLLEKNDETLNYVYYYPERSMVSSGNDLLGETEYGEIPLLLQWDERWGYLTYGDGMIGYTGCGPTCLSMVAIALTGDTSVTPAAVARYAEENGHYIAGSGTSWSLMSQGCEAFGLKARELPLNETTVIRALEEGQPVICSMRAGDFTDGGHFIVLTGYRNGFFTVNDPNSRINSAKNWSWERLEGQIKNIWTYASVI